MTEKYDIENSTQKNQVFSGHIYIFHAFDIGDDVNLDKIKESGEVTPRPLKLSKYFKRYHIPLAIDLPNGHASANWLSAKIYSFGALSIIYKIPFEDTLENLRKQIEDIDNKCHEQSVVDASSIYKKIKRFTSKPKFFHTRSSYPVIQVTPTNDITASTLEKEYGALIASTIRFEQQTLSEYHIEEMLEDAIGYFKGDLIVIDSEAAFVYDKEHEETLDFFEFANIQHLELQYFNATLNKQLNTMYEERTIKLPFTSYLPFIGTQSDSPISELGRLRVDISVIVERLEDSIRIVGEAYYSEIYDLLAKKRELYDLKDSINKKLSIIEDIRTVYQHQIDSIREDILSVLIIILIMIEVVLGFMHLR